MRSKRIASSDFKIVREGLDTNVNDIVFELHCGLPAGVATTGAGKLAAGRGLSTFNLVYKCQLEATSLLISLQMSMSCSKLTAYVHATGKLGLYKWGLRALTIPRWPKLSYMT